MRYRPIPLLCAAILTASLLGSGNAFASTIVSVELSLAVDVSGSIDSSEFTLQKQGYANAFLDPAVQALIAGTPNGIAVNFIYWSGNAQQTQAVAWTLITNAAQATAFANAINATTRPYNGSTAVGQAITFATPLFASNSFTGSSLILDISSDGTDNVDSTTYVSTARANALSAGLTINALAIGTDVSVYNYYHNSIIGGPHAFVNSVGTFADFDAAIKEKITTELTQATAAVPEPSSIAMLGIGAIGLVGLVRRRKKS